MYQLEGANRIRHSPRKPVTMPLSWNEIRSRAHAFALEFRDATREKGETQTFYNDFFNIFGMTRRRVASFEEPVKALGDKAGFIDLFWKGMLLVEQKSAGRDLSKAKGQAFKYFPGLKEEELPRYLLLSDFQTFELYDLDTGAEHRFTLAELPDRINLFGFIAGYQKREFKDQDPVNIAASEQMGKLHDMLAATGYTGHDLELFLVRLLFCLFADDTGIFPKDTLRFYLEERTRPDGSDLGMHLSMVFQTLNTPEARRARTLDEDLAAFPYVNGSLFAARLDIPSFDAAMRATLIAACYFNWGQISPAIFGSLFQSVMDKDKRRGIGAHYTTEANILKIVKPLFLDDLRAELDAAKRSPGANGARLRQLHDKLADLTFLDPACGCGNFLILAYRELRLLEIELLQALYPSGQLVLDAGDLSRVNVDAFYGIELEEFPARIAEVALWLMDHQMNLRLSEAFGLYYARIPLAAAAHIHHGNALATDWASLVPPARLRYLLGNPPFVGKKEQTAAQKNEVMTLFAGVQGAGVLDYVAAWYLKAAQYIQGTAIVCAFVSTNSITQGEQVAVLWQELLNRYRIKLHFAHRTFAWSSDARGKAAVHCVIVGFAAFDTAKPKLLYEYADPKGSPDEARAANINPYLTAAADILITKRSQPLCDVPEINKGSEATDFGHLILSEDDKASLISREPKAERWIRQYMGGEEFINSTRRYCLWLVGVSPTELREMPLLMERVKMVQQARLKSDKARTREWAKLPALFSENRQPITDYLLIPKVSSERRRYLPIGFCQRDIIASGSVLVIPSATLYHFGVLSSSMHNDWMRAVCGRMKSDYQYSATIVYNNFPWPTDPTPAQVNAIEAAAQAVLDARAAFPGSALADLYDPLTMPPALTKAHQALDRAVDRAYRSPAFEHERARLEYLFARYQALTAPLLPAGGKAKRAR
jgi:hypothetical protein